MRLSASLWSKGSRLSPPTFQSIYDRVQAALTRLDKVVCFADKIHEYKGRGSAQGIAAGIVADVCGKSPSSSGTLMDGYSCTLFHLLYRFSPEIRSEFGRSEEARWIQRYGFLEQTIGKPAEDGLEDGRQSRPRKYREVVRERPGLAPRALFHLIGHTVFLRLSDVASGLPPYEEQVLLSSMDREEDQTGYSQRSGYDEVAGTLRAALASDLAAGSRRLLAAYLLSLLASPDGCTRGETVFDPETENLLVQVPPLADDKLYPKEQALVELVAAERMARRRVLVYVTHTGTRDITGRMNPFVTRNGFKVAVMKADAVAPDKREACVAKPDAQGVDVLICHPRLVQTGLDLVAFRAICWFETDYSGYTMRQASRRSWRIRPDRPGQGRVHGLPEHAPGRRAQAGRAEAAEFARSRRRTARGQSHGVWRRWRRPAAGSGPRALLERA